jgi:hypothetical protein
VRHTLSIEHAALPRAGSATVILSSNLNNSELNGRYAFLFQRYDSCGSHAIVGSFGPTAVATLPLASNILTTVRP